MINCLSGAFKRLLQWKECTEVKEVLVNNWSTAYVGAFKRLILWIEGTEEKNDLVFKWSATSMGAFKRLKQ